jgi:hypothetical protein
MLLFFWLLLYFLWTRSLFSIYLRLLWMEIGGIWVWSIHFLVIGDPIFNLAFNILQMRRNLCLLLDFWPSLVRLSLWRIMLRFLFPDRCSFLVRFLNSTLIVWFNLLLHIMFLLFLCFMYLLWGWMLLNQLLTIILMICFSFSFIWFFVFLFLLLMVICLSRWRWQWVFFPISILFPLFSFLQHVHQVVSSLLHLN